MRPPTMPARGLASASRTISRSADTLRPARRLSDLEQVACPRVGLEHARGCRLPATSRRLASLRTTRRAPRSIGLGEASVRRPRLRRRSPASSTRITWRRDLGVVQLEQPLDRLLQELPAVVAGDDHADERPLARLGARLAAPLAATVASRAVARVATRDAPLPASLQRPPAGASAGSSGRSWN